MISEFLFSNPAFLFGRTNASIQFTHQPNHSLCLLKVFFILYITNTVNTLTISGQINGSADSYFIKNTAVVSQIRYRSNRRHIIHPFDCGMVKASLL